MSFAAGITGVSFWEFASEENAQSGATHYLAKPLFPLDKTIAMINFDRIGQLRNETLSLIGVTSGGEMFDKLVDEVNTDKPPLKLNKVDTGPESDHRPFEDSHIPVIFFHTSQDDDASVDVPGVAKIISFAERVIKKIAQSDVKPTFAGSDRGPRRDNR